MTMSACLGLAPLSVSVQRDWFSLWTFLAAGKIHTGRRFFRKDKRVETPLQRLENRFPLTGFSGSADKEMQEGLGPAYGIALGRTPPHCVLKG